MRHRKRVPDQAHRQSRDPTALGHAPSYTAHLPAGFACSHGRCAMLPTCLGPIGTEMPGRLSIDDLLQIRYPTESVPPRLSPDGRSLALTVSPAVSSQDGGSSREYDARHVPQTVAGSQITVIDIPTGALWQPFPHAEVSWGRAMVPRRLNAGGVYRHGRPGLSGHTASR